MVEKFCIYSYRFMMSRIFNHVQSSCCPQEPRLHMTGDYLCQSKWPITLPQGSELYYVIANWQINQIPRALTQGVKIFACHHLFFFFFWIILQSISSFITCLMTGREFWWIVYEICRARVIGLDLINNMIPELKYFMNTPWNIGGAMSNPCDVLLWMWL